MLQKIHSNGTFDLRRLVYELLRKMIGNTRIDFAVFVVMTKTTDDSENQRTHASKLPI